MLVPPVFNQSRVLFTRPKKIFHRLLNDSKWILWVYFVRAEPADPQPLDVFRALSQYLYPYISTIQSKERLYSKINLVFCGYIQITESSSMCNICHTCLSVITTQCSIIGPHLCLPAPHIPHYYNPIP